MCFQVMSFEAVDCKKYTALEGLKVQKIIFLTAQVGGGLGVSGLQLSHKEQKTDPSIPFMFMLKCKTVSIHPSISHSNNFFALKSRYSTGNIFL